MKFLKWALFLTIGVAFMGHAQEVWTLRNPLPTADDLNSIIWTGKQLVAVGDAGTIITSPDGIVWSNRISGTSENLHSPTWTGLQHIILGKNGAVLTSHDAITWTKRSPGTDAILNNITWTGKEYLSIGPDSSLYRSPDLIQWSNSEIHLKYDTTSITWSDSDFVTGIGKIYTAPDGSKWKYHLWTSSEYDKPTAYIDTEFVEGIGTFYTTADGRKWRGPADPKSALSKYRTFQKTWTGSLFVVVEDRRILTSPDTINWTAQDIGTANRKINSVTWTGKQIVAVGDGGTILTSPDGITWTENTHGLKNWLSTVIWGGNQFVAVGDFGTIVTSPDGIFWTSQNSGTKETLGSILWINNHYIIQTQNGSILTSPDAITWTLRIAGYKEYFIRVPRVRDAILNWTGTQFALLEPKGTFLTSPDAITWNKPNLDTSEILYDFVWTGNQFIITGINGNIFTSPDGINFTKRNSLKDRSLYLKLYKTKTDFRVIAYADSGFILSSRDGITWTDESADPSLANEFPFAVHSHSDAIWTGNFFVRSFWGQSPGGGIESSPDSLNWTVRHWEWGGKIGIALWTGTYLVALGSGNTNEEILISSDGITWDAPKIGTHLSISSIATNGRQIVAVGVNGVILSSPQVSPTKISFPQNAGAPIKKELSLRWSNSTLTATLPTFMQGQEVHIILRNITGKKVLERTVNKTQREVLIPISGFPNGRYVLEVKGVSQKGSKSFSIIR